MSQDILYSSEVEFEPAVLDDENPWAGQKSIDKLLLNADRDRLKSKQFVKQLKFGYGVPTTRYDQSLWVRRFEGYRKDTLKHDLSSPFKGEHLLRFLDSVLDTMDTRRDKPGPNISSIRKAYNILIHYGNFHWSKEDDFLFTRRDSERFRSFLDTLIREKRIVRGRWGSKTWIGFVTLSRLVRTFLDHWALHGALNWDIVVVKSLSLVLVASLGARGGDVTQSRGYKDPVHLQYRHVKLYLEAPTSTHTGLDNAPKLTDLRAEISMEFVKGHKVSRNETFIKYLRPLNEETCRHVCPISLLLTHALRHGLVHGTTIQDVLKHTTAQTDRCVRWTYPNRPVLPMFANDPYRCLLDVPATPTQLLSTVKEMGLLAGMLDRAYTHAIRFGAARDVAHLPSTAAGMGFTNDQVRQSMGHTAQSMWNGTTNEYVGDPTREFYNDIAVNRDTVPHREPRFAARTDEIRSHIQAPVTAEELQAMMGDRNPATLTRHDKATLEARVRLVRQEKIIETVDVEPPRGPSTPYFVAPSPPVQLPLTTLRNRRTALADLSVNSTDLHGKATVGTVNGGHSRNNDSEHELSDHTDPILLGEDIVAELEVNPSHLEKLHAKVFSGLEANNPGRQPDLASKENVFRSPYFTATNASTHVATFADVATVADDVDDDYVDDDFASDPRQQAEDERLNLGDSCRDATSAATLSAEQWINSHAQYNVLKNEKFARKWVEYQKTNDDQLFDTTIGLHCFRGNSRNDPQPFVYTCRKISGCPYQSIRAGQLRQHESTCTELRVQARNEPVAETLHCEQCGFKTTAGKACFREHARSFHQWTPKPCENGCQPEKLYKSRAQYVQHIDFVHNGRFPIACSYPDCVETKMFNEPKTLHTHLEKHHGLTDINERNKYLPPRKAVPTWVEQGCVVTACRSKSVFKRIKDLRQHLVDRHQMEKDQANALIEEKAKFVLVSPAIRVCKQRPSGQKKKRPLEAEEDDIAPPSKKPEKTKGKKKT